MIGQSVSEVIRARSASIWERAVNHRLFGEIATDQVSDAVFNQYLRIEFGFIDTAAVVMGFAIAKAPDLETRRHLSRGLNGLTTDQCLFFEAALKSAPEATPIRPPRADGLHNHFLTIARNEEYPEIVACMLAAEWMYETWCRRAIATPSSRPHIADWVALHAGGPFAAQVAWMRAQLDSVAEQGRNVDRLFQVFHEALEQEIRFHDAAYESV